MKIEHFPDTDTLSIVLSTRSGEVSAADANDREIAVLIDGEGRIVEVLIEHASSRTDLDAIRERLSFEEVNGSHFSSAREH